MLYNNLSGQLDTIYLGRLFISNWSYLHTSPYNEPVLSISEQDVRVLHRAFNEDTFCLIRLSAAVSATAQSPAGTKQHYP